jgi:1,4-dihydroxy-2-naphthoate octaprenyltransferase
MAKKSFLEYLKSSIIGLVVILIAIGAGIVSFASFVFGDIILGLVFGGIALVGLFYNSYRLDELDRYRMGR